METAALTSVGIFWPVMALVGWTVAVLLLVPYQRFKAVFAGHVTAADFHCGESDNVPVAVALPNRVFMNLLEVPVLFYVLCVVSYVTQNVGPGIILLAWAYFGFRVAHSLIYLTYNHVMHRFLTFATSNVILVVMWLRLLHELAD